MSLPSYQQMLQGQLAELMWLADQHPDHYGYFLALAEECEEELEELIDIADH